jgi:photosystem II stability/assembly factor-like uncharacterized protein
MPKRKAAGAACVLLVCALLPGHLAAGQNSWTTNGPYGGSISAIALDPSNPNTLYAGTYSAGIFKSTNGGSKWSPANAGLANQSVRNIAINSGDPRVLYAGTDSGLFKSTDGARSWSDIGVSAGFIWATAISSSNPGIVFACSGVFVAGNPINNLYRSLDAGKTWAAVTSGLPAGNIGPVALDPSNDATVYVVVADRLFRSRDLGGTWSEIGAGSITGPIASIALDPTAPGVVCVASTGVGIFRSSDGGDTWTPANEGVTSPYIRAIVAVQSSIYTVADVAVFRSDDHGETWTALGVAGLRFPPLLSTIAVTPSSPATFYAATYRGLFKSSDGGTTWEGANTGINAINASTLAVPEGNTQVAFAGTGHGVYRTSNRGISWELKSDGLHYASDIISLGLDPTNKDRLYAGAVLCCGLYKTVTGGDLWNRVFVTGWVTSIVIDPKRPPRAFEADAFNGVSRTLDDGATWTSINSGIPYQRTLPTALVIDPSRTDTLYLSAAAYSEFNVGGVFKTINGGDTWKPAGDGITDPDVLFLTMDPANPRTIYAGTRGGGLFRTRNAGHVWNSLGSGVPTPLYSLAVDPTQSSTLYLGAGRSGVYRSSDGGETWSPFGFGFGDAEIYRVATDSTGRVLYAATNRGVFQYEILGGSFYTLTPCRLIDTREPANGPAFDADSERVFSLTGSCSIPPTARSVALNISVTEATTQGYLTLYETAIPAPEAISIAYRSGLTRANNAIVGLDPLGRMTVKCNQPSGTVHVILDVTGYFQ